ncbi:hypothetical protein SteCoe_6805 [Stentor coeruleus]|uniref:Uncharacterized protein n=1 Tax=Stentor coeruleus TaxID=5963 RepID=A0A1R2CNY8_9CILI|nr:hypothetical protein SteCoe_6805 [Stentor coeruleus]
MEEKSWLWVLNNLSVNASSTICCINICPLIIFKNNQPFKAIYTDLNGRLISKVSPLQSEIISIFQTTLNSVLFSIKCFDQLGNCEIYQEKHLESLLINSNFIGIQGVKEHNQVFHHKIEYFDNAYSSFPFILKGKVIYPVNDIAIEKILLVYSINCLHLLEKTKEFMVNGVEIVYLKDKIGKFWIETINNCILARRDAYRMSILQSKLVISSCKLVKAEKCIKKSFSIDKLQRSSIALKPRLKISQVKFSNISLPKLSQTQNYIKPVCYGAYCDEQIRLTSVTHSRKVSARIYFSLSHELIKRAFKLIQFPSSENEFSERFCKIYKDLLSTHYGKSLVTKTNIQKQEQDKNDTIKLCPMCFKIFFLASSVETPLTMNN